MSDKHKSDQTKAKSALSDEDRELFRQATLGVKPLKRQSDKTTQPVSHTTKTSRPPKAKPQKARANISQCLQQLDLSNHIIESVAHDTKLYYCAPGGDRRVLEKLRRGKYQIEAVLDIHGMNIEQAREHLLTFLQSSLRRRCRFVRIIHGKGISSGMSHAPPLKNQINNWLRQIHYVLGFCSAPTGGGGTGAVDVILRIH